jgi:hypothetical protein
MKPTLTELISKLEEQFGKLNSQAEHCAEDFHENYQDFINSIQSKKIIIIASPNMLATKLQEPKYTRYRTFGGLSILLFIAGIITLFFNWKIGLGLILGSFLAKFISTKMKNSSSKNFAFELTSKIKETPDDGMFDVCQYYIAGILQLASTKGRAHLPLIPSYSLTGVEEFARREK